MCLKFELALVISNIIIPDYYLSTIAKYLLLRIKVKLQEH